MIRNVFPCHGVSWSDSVALVTRPHVSPIVVGLVSYTFPYNHNWHFSYLWHISDSRTRALRVACHRFYIISHTNSVYFTQKSGFSLNWDCYMGIRNSPTEPWHLCSVWRSAARPCRPGTHTRQMLWHTLAEPVYTRMQRKVLCRKDQRPDIRTLQTIHHLKQNYMLIVIKSIKSHFYPSPNDFYLVSRACMKIPHNAQANVIRTIWKKLC